jgi:RNA polymerase sigma-70 factor (ECF subfamily)
MTLIDFIATTDRQGQLMLAYANGEAAAFEALYTHYKGQLYRFFTRQCGNRALAEELYQELWLRVIRQRASYEHKARFSTWLYRIAHNLLLDHFRKHEPAFDDDSDSVLESLPAAEDSDPATQYLALEQQARFLQRLQALPAAQRQVFLLKEEAGLSLEDIAQVTGVSFESVKSRLRYAIKKLKETATEAA